jgi:alcohol dehydrogenase class IV
MDFTFYSPDEIIFGCGKIDDIGKVASRFGRKAMICLRGSSIEKHGILEKVRLSLSQAGVDCFVERFPSGEPIVSDIDQGARLAREKQPDLIIGVGGGSTIDTAKAISGMATHDGSVVDYLEGVGRGWTLSKPTLPFIAVPTTAGTGAEVTKNAVIASREGKYKKSIRSALLVPDVALLDPELSLTVPADITAETGMDALTQLIESYVSIKAQPIPTALALYGIELCGKYLQRACRNGGDKEAREGMMLASLLSGLALANSGLGAAHGIAAALGAIAEVPHGRACAMLLPGVMRLNLPHVTKQFAEIGRRLGLKDRQNERLLAEEMVEYVEALCQKIGIPTRLGAKGQFDHLIPQLVAGSQGSSMKGNPVVLSEEQIESVIKSIL